MQGSSGSPAVPPDTDLSASFSPSLCLLLVTMRLPQPRHHLHPPGGRRGGAKGKETKPVEAAPL